MDRDFINSPLLPSREPADSLLPRIMKTIALERQRQILRRKIFIFSTCFSLVLLSIIPAIKFFITDISYSGFGEYLRLASTDFSTISTYWQEWAMSLLESLPALSLAILLLISVALLISFKNILNNFKKFSKLSHLTIN